MKSEKKQESKLKKMWADTRGKAILKLGIWFSFFCLMGIILMIMNLFSKPTIPNNNLNNKNNVTTPSQTIEFVPLETAFEKLMTSDWKYHYQVKTIETSETITYDGEKKEGIDTGYRESKIGIIRYKIKEGKTYQIFMETEEELANLYNEEDKPYFNLETIKSELDQITPSETKNETTKTLIYQNTSATYVVTMSTQEIKSIQITTQEKEYRLTYT